jgi:NAD(P)-dependent dehydrogenase (short-subunit alcohol dehydrogenase family)
MPDGHARKVVLITGASSGIGLTCANHLAARGWRVFGTQRSPLEGTRSHSGVEMLTMDVDSDESVAAGIGQILAASQRLDAVVNNAGTALMGPVEETDLQEARAQLETNFFGAFRVCKHVLTVLREQGGGHIVNISSLAGIVGVPFSGMYSASKFALEGLSQALRLETRPFGVRVSVIEPGNFRTALTERRRSVAAMGNNTCYSGAFRSYRAAQDREEAEAPAPVAIAQLLERVLNTRNPKFRYPVARFHQRMMVPLLHLLPQSLFERLLCRAIGLTS